MEHTIGTVRALMLFAAATFIVAASVHFGALLEGYGHRDAGTAETVIAVVLLVGTAFTWSESSWRRNAAIGAQAFAILGVLVGLFTIAVGVGPRTALDIVYHIAILAVLVGGLAIAVWGLSR